MQGSNSQLQPRPHLIPVPGGISSLPITVRCTDGKAIFYPFGEISLFHVLYGFVRKWIISLYDPEWPVGHLFVPEESVIFRPGFVNLFGATVLSSQSRSFLGQREHNKYGYAIRGLSGVCMV